jgi:hypothetical protein
VNFSYDEVEACTYCGQPASEIDHVHPRAGHPHEATARTQGLLVPTCGECNRTAGAHIFTSLAQKREWVHFKLRRRYRTDLGLPHWSEREMASLGPTLRGNLEAAQKRQWILSQRVSYKCDGRCRRGAVEDAPKEGYESFGPDSLGEAPEAVEAQGAADTAPTDPVSEIQNRFEVAS